MKYLLPRGIAMDVEIVGLIASLLAIAAVVWRSVKGLVLAIYKLIDRVENWDQTALALNSHLGEHEAAKKQLNRIEGKLSE